MIPLPPQVQQKITRLQPSECITISSRRGRKIAVVRANDGSLKALDAHCFHQGANLSVDGTMQLVDIEDSGECAVRCPRHGFLINTTTGELCMSSGHAAATCLSSAVQRTHKVVLEPDGAIKIALSDGDEHLPITMLPSDAHNLPPSRSTCPTIASAEAASPAAGRSVLSGPGGVSRISFACRKSLATSAVTAVASRKSSEPCWQQSAVSAPFRLPGMSSTATTSPRVTGTSGSLRQATLLDVGIAASTPPPPPPQPVTGDVADVSTDGDAMDLT